MTQGGRSLHDVEKARKRLEIERDELQNALDEAEVALEQEDAKVQRTQLELATVKQDIERRLTEKEDEFENTRLVIVIIQSCLLSSILL